MKIRPVLLSGGSGTRLWPVSRRRHPKQFAELLGDCSLLSAALEMLDKAGCFLAPVIVANEDHKFFVLDAIGGPASPSAVLLEPCGRNTAAAAIAAALAEKDRDVLHLLMPSDHVITDAGAFIAAIHAAAPAAQNGRIALFGIAPDHPETGYGYIRRGAASAWPQVDAIESFTEKPDAATAAALIAEGALWNSGIFLYHPETLITEAETLAPEHPALCRAALETAISDLGCIVLGSYTYERLAPASLDRLVMEKTRRGVVVPCTIGWSDVGSWEALWRLGDKDASGNVAKGPVVAMDTHNSYLRSDGPVIGVVGLGDIAVVATKDAVLVAPRSRAQDVRDLAAELEAGQHKAATETIRIMRPWGCYEGITEGERFRVKHITVRPGQSLSLQMHRYRAEHWVVVQGAALVERDGIEQLMAENQSIYIPKRTKHRLANPGKTDLHLVEVQTGNYLGEDDIVRFSDMYGRVTPEEEAEDDGLENVPEIRKAVRS